MPLPAIISQFPHVATGPTLVTFTGDDLGFAEDQIDIEERPFFREVKADSFGGAEGPPIDLQFTGALVFVRATLNRINESNCRDLGWDYADTAGTLPAVGEYQRQDEKWGLLQLKNRSHVMQFEQAVLRQGKSFNAGTRHRKYVLLFECHVNTPCNKVLYTYEDAEAPCDTILSS